MAKPKHRELAAESAPLAPDATKTVYDPGGDVGVLHDWLEQRLSATRTTAMVPYTAPIEPAEQFIHSVSRIGGPVALIAASAVLVWAVLTA